MNSKKQFSLVLPALVALLLLAGAKAEARVDQPHVPTVPEPGTVAMMVAGGVAGVGLMLRARRK